jgi:pimeloyl-ACP methyl ester carboxylesterase
MGLHKAVLAFILLFAEGCVPATVPHFYSDFALGQSSPHGSLVRYQLLAGAPPGSKAFRIIYQSNADDGVLIPVSAMVVIPTGTAPTGGRPVIAWAHPTTGLQAQCGPSLSSLRYVMIPGLSEMLRAGFIVAATDYPGLGAGGVHPFLDGASEGRAVLDSIRAAARLPGASTSSSFALWGHSQGGQAVLFAAKLAHDYTPELKLAGVAAAAPATDLAALFRDDLGSSGGNNLAALTLWSWQKVYGASYVSVVAPSAVSAIAVIASKCIDTFVPSRAKERADKVLTRAYFTVPDITTVAPWRSLIERNSPGILPSNIPVLLAQGTADVTVRQAVTYDYGARLCRSGSSVTLDTLPAGTHAWAAMDSARVAVSWMAELINGVAVPNDCLSVEKLAAGANPGK